MRVVFEYLEKIRKRILGFVKYISWKIMYGNGVKVGKKSFFYPGCNLLIEHKGKVEIGNNCFFNRNCSINALGKIRIGSDCIFGESVKIYDHNHKIDKANKAFRLQGFNIGTIEIGNNVWVGSNTIILPNVKIGNNVVIAAGSIVTKSIEDDVVFIQKRISCGERG